MTNRDCPIHGVAGHNTVLHAALKAGMKEDQLRDTYDCKALLLRLVNSQLEHYPCGCFEFILDDAWESRLDKQDTKVLAACRQRRPWTPKVPKRKKQSYPRLYACYELNGQRYASTEVSAGEYKIEQVESCVCGKHNQPGGQQ